MTMSVALTILAAYLSGQHGTDSLLRSVSSPRVVLGAATGVDTEI